MTSAHRPVVAMDCDDVPIDFQNPFLAIINEECGTNHKFTDPRGPQWDLLESLSVPPRAANRILARVRARGWCASLRPTPGAIDGVMRLQEIADVFFVTTPLPRARHWAHERVEWLGQYLGVGMDRIVQTSAKHLIAADVLVDDRVETLVRWKRTHPGGLAVKWRSPSNEHAAHTDGPTIGGSADDPAADWDELIREVQHHRTAHHNSPERVWRTW